MAFWRRGCFSWALKDKWDEGARGGGAGHLWASRCKGPGVHVTEAQGKAPEGSRSVLGKPRSRWQFGKGHLRWDLSNGK